MCQQHRNQCQMVFTLWCWAGINALVFMSVLCASFIKYFALDWRALATLSPHYHVTLDLCGSL